MSAPSLPRVALLVGLLVLATLALLGVVETHRPAPQSTPAPQTRQLTRSRGLSLYPSFSPDGERLVYCAELGRGFELRLREADGRERALTDGSGHDVQPDWSPDGRTVVFHSRVRGGLWLLPLDGGPARQLTRFGARPAWSPDGKRVAFQSEPQVDASWAALSPLPPSTVWVVPADGGEPRPVTRPGEPPGGHGSPAWTPRGDRIVFVGYDRVRALLWTVAPDGSGLSRIPLPQDQPLVSEPASCRDCDSLYYVASSETGSSGVWKVRLSGGAGPEWVPSNVLGTGLQWVRHLALSADGRRMSYASITLDSQLASVTLDPVTQQASGEPRLLTSGEGRSSRPLFSPDGSRIAYTHLRPGGRSDVWMANADGSEAVPLTDDPGADSMPSWFPAGDRVGFVSGGSGHNVFWSVEPRTHHKTALRDLGEDIDAPRASPDGRTLAFHWGRGGGTTNTWSVPLDREGPPHRLTSDPEFAGFPAYSPDGRYLALQIKRGATTHVGVMPARGGSIELVTSGDGLHWAHSWAPDSERIAFAGLREGFWNVGFVSRASRRLVQVTHHHKLNAYVRYPAWSPRGDTIVYEYAETVGEIWAVDLR